MGVSVSLSLILESTKEAEAIQQSFFATIVAYEQQFSRFLPDSELSQLNQHQNLVVSEAFFAVLQKSLLLFQNTDRIFNPLLQISRYGYDRDFSSLPEVSKTTPETTPYDIDFTTVRLDEETRRVTLQPGQQLDFGGILKGYLAHKLSRNISMEYPHCLGNIVNIGGDLFTSGVDENGEPFQFSIFNPITKEQIPVTVANAGLATSGTYKRTWQIETGTRHHILDTQHQGAAPSTICSASVIHPDGATADAYAKLFLLKGIAEAVRISQDTNTGAILIHSDGTVEKHNL